MAFTLARAWAQLSALLVPGTPELGAPGLVTQASLADQVLGMLWRWVLLGGALVALIGITSAAGWVFG